ncbi:methyl-accepting chemotaxis protein [Pseudaeromonas paramecii]|uniref:Methyl-accepting chemotaxis protein n=1 Tax=Pseudaeromonas paramecii TaxID=2138166 RepID=A0ABP8PUP6_9GAMM
MNLTVKVVVAFAILCGLMAFGGGISWFNMNRIDSAFSFVVKDMKGLDEQAGQLGSGLLRLNKLTADMVFATDQASLERHRQAFDSQVEGLNANLAQLQSSVNQLQDAQALTSQLAPLQQQITGLLALSQPIYASRSQILAEGARIGTVKDELLNKLAFAKIGADKLFKPYAAEDPYIGGLGNQFIEWLGTLEYMVNAIFSAQRVTDMQPIEKKAKAMGQMLLDGYGMLQREVPAIADNSDIQAGLAALKQNVNSDQGAIGRFIGLSQQREQLEQQVQQIAQAIDEALVSQAALQSAANGLSQQAFVSAKSTLNTTSLSVIISVLVSLLFAGIVGWRLSAAIKGPMAVIQRVLDKMAKGDFSNRVDGRFTGEFAILQRDINAVVLAFNQALKVVREGAEQTRLTAERNRQFADSLAAQVQVQSGTMTTLAATVTEMEHAIEDVNNNTESSLAMVLSVDDQIQEGRHLVQENTQRVEKLYENLRHSEQTIEEVNGQSERIGGILEVIESISEQTNLLALNAAIEAARAGEHGRGFAVVADEVRNLASRTGESTKEIHAMISNLRSKSTSAVSSMQSSLSLMGDSQTMMEQVNDAMGVIAQHMQQVRDASELIAHATREQTQASREISRSINEMSDVVEQSSRTMSDMAAQTQILDELCLAQDKTVGQFRLAE